MKIEYLIELNVWNEVAVFGLVGHVDDELPLERDLVGVRIKNFGNVLTLFCRTNQNVNEKQNLKVKSCFGKFQQHLLFHDSKF